MQKQMLVISVMHLQTVMTLLYFSCTPVKLLIETINVVRRLMSSLDDSSGFIFAFLRSTKQILLLLLLCPTVT